MGLEDLGGVTLVAGFWYIIQRVVRGVNARQPTYPLCALLHKN